MASSSPALRPRSCRWRSGISCSERIPLCGRPTKWRSLLFCPRFSDMSEPKVISRLARYDEDFHAWSVEQAARLRETRPGTIDWENVAEEIESLGKSDRRKVASELKTILEHLIKWRYQPQKRKAGWRSSIREHRDRIDRNIADSPGLRRLPAQVLAEEYRKARRAALDDTGLPADRVPERSPFSVDEV